MAGRIEIITASRAGDYIACGEAERVVHVFDARLQKKVRTFDSTLDFGGGRLAIDGAGRFCAVGNYEREGVALYSLVSGKEIWRRREFRKVQHVRFLDLDSKIICSHEDGPLAILDRATGETIETLRGVKYLFAREDCAFSLRDGARLMLFDETRGVVSLTRESFAVLSACFTSDRLCLSEATGPTRCLSLADGAELWRYTPRAKTHVLTLCATAAQDRVYAVLYDYENPSHLLMRLDAATGEAQPVCELPNASAHAFLAQGGRIVAADGVLRDSASGEIVGKPSVLTRGRPRLSPNAPSSRGFCEFDQCVFFIT